MNIKEFRDVSIIALCLTIASVVAIGGGFALFMMISNANGFD